MNDHARRRHLRPADAFDDHSRIKLLEAARQLPRVLIAARFGSRAADEGSEGSERPDL